MREVPIKFILAFLALIMLTTPAFLSYSVSAEDEVDNWPSGDAWLYIELLSWSANETVEWDNNNGLPDPHFEICIEADGVNIDCIDTPTWDNQMELVNPWNYSIDIPDYSNILNITIECRDNDAINDDECDMNSELDEWKLYAQYNWSLTPTKGVIGNGSGDQNGTWKNAASEWRFTIDGYGDEDSDGVSDNLDNCPGTLADEELGSNLPIGCSWYQFDVDFDGIISRNDSEPFNIGIGHVIGGNRELIPLGSSTINMHHVSCSKPESSYTHTLGFTEQRIPMDGGTYGQPNSSTTMSCNPSQVWNRPLFDINFDGIIEHYSEEGLRTFEQGYNGESSFQSFDVCGGGGGINWDSPGLNAKQIPGEQTILIHCQTQITNRAEECSTIYSIQLVNESNISVESAHSLENCKNVSDNSWHPSQSGGGVFGDFDGNGKLDLIVDTDNGCDIYYGLDTENVSFFGPQAILSPSMCGTEMMVVADIDNDGFDDLVSYSYVHFFSDGSIESVEFLLDVDGGTHNAGVEERREVLVVDIDEDGDLDIIRSRSVAGGDRVSVKPNLILNSWIPDIDSDTIADSIDLCNSTPAGSIVDSQGCADFEKDTDNDGVTNDLDLCPSTMPSWIVDEIGCAAEQLDDDNDQINNVLDECPDTPEGDLVNVRGCSYEDTFPGDTENDDDNDGVVDSNDDCPNTQIGEAVNIDGCSFNQGADSYQNQGEDAFVGAITHDGIDHNGDGVVDCSDYNFITVIPSSEIASYDQYGCLDSDRDGISDWSEVVMNLNPYDSDTDNDGFVDGSDKCPHMNSDGAKDPDEGCFGVYEDHYDNGQNDEIPDESNSESSDAATSSAGDTFVGFTICCLLPIGGIVYFTNNRKKKTRQHRVHTPPSRQQHIPIQRQPSQQEVQAQMLHQKQIEAQHLQNQLAQQASQTQYLQQQLAKQSRSASEMKDMQEELAQLQESKAALEQELEETSKATTVVQNITYNIQDSAISGDLNANLNPKEE